ncbi:hypothetical protein ASPTUDRAFT_49165 [Aspergillus tubingensis CBS 134.48]|uniref:Uncharacterized protein n=1 Tax=Aspergillus tubingensis (strain CBS 134.48) TaxID=767770 RepID=A0A1L9NK06_ASPTC|nr:hypothetical protein ASPTUDRAFT_49165 [Aspergillus tubingensis CBS 134.48]
MIRAIKFPVPALILPFLLFFRLLVPEFLAKDGCPPLQDLIIWSDSTPGSGRKSLTISILAASDKV